MPQLRVGFIGLGTMGLPMARNLAKAGFPLSVTTKTFSKAEDFARDVPGTRVFKSAQEVGRESDVVVSSVPDAPEVELVHLGDRGTASARGPSSSGCATGTLTGGPPARDSSRMTPSWSLHWSPKCGSTSAGSDCG